jgi:ankyrin repeat protein
MKLITCITAFCLTGSTCFQEATAQTQTLDDLFPTDRLVRVDITLDEEDWDEIRFQTRNLLEVLQPKRQFQPIDSPYTYVDASVTIDGVTYPRVGVRKKGFIGSLDNDRPSLKVKLDHVEEGTNIGGLDNLTFNNNKQDTSLMSQFMTYGLFDLAGSPGPRCAYAKVTVNGKDLGVYCHVESMKKQLLEREFGSDKGTLYEGTVVDFYEDWDESFERKSGKNKPGRAHIRKVIEAFELDDDDEFQETLWELVDEKSFYTFWTLEGLLSFWDGYSGNRNNFFIYLDPRTGKFHFMPWGADALFQKYSPLGVDPESPRSVRLVGRIAHRLYQIPSVRKKYAARMKKLMRTLWDEEDLIAETERIEAMIDPHLASNQRYEVDFDAIREFIRNRRGDVEPEISGNDMPLWDEQPDEPPVLDEGMFEGEGGEDTIWAAALLGDTEGVAEFLEDDVDIDTLQDGKVSPLGFAAMANKIETMRFLLEKGADPSIVGSDFNTPIHGAAFLGRVEAVELLIEAGANLDKINQDGATPFDAAAAPWSPEIKGIVEFVALILGLEIDIDEVRTGREQAAKIIHRHGGESATDFDSDEEGDLWAAAKNGDIETLEELLDDGADPNAQDQLGITPLSWCAMTGHKKAAELLVEHGADVNQPNRDGGTALHAAAFLGNTEMVQFLIAEGANVRARNQGGETPLDSASAPWSEELKGIIMWIGGALKLKIDLEKVERGRPKAAELLRKAGNN